MLWKLVQKMNIPLIVLDRPNPNGGIVDGPLLEKEFTSFVGMHPIPVTSRYDNWRICTNDQWRKMA